MELQQRLEILSDASQYDLACACGTCSEDRRHRGRDGRWTYPVSLARGGKGIMLKTLLSNACSNDCSYCPFRSASNLQRCSMTPAEVAKAFDQYNRRLKLSGLFVSTGLTGTPDQTMERMIEVAGLVRKKYEYKGFVHLKVMPGASDEAIQAMLRHASAVSINVEAPKASSFRRLCQSKDFEKDIVRPLKTISRLTAPGERFAGVGQTTQFIVGASDESDADLVEATHRLYRRQGLNRVYYSAYQQGLGEPSIPGESGTTPQQDRLTREHRLYQVDFLLRQYKWTPKDLAFDEDQRLSLMEDPKQVWANRHPEYFPVSLTRASREELLRVPGLGPVTVHRILKARNETVIRSLVDVGVKGKRLKKAQQYTVLR